MLSAVFLNAASNSASFSGPGFPLVDVSRVPATLLLDIPQPATLPEVGLARKAFQLNTTLLGLGWDRFSVPLLNGAVVWLQVEERKSVLGTIKVMKGRIEHSLENSFILATEGNVVSGTLNIGGQAFSIRHVEGTMHMIVVDDPYSGGACGVQEEEDWAFSAQSFVTEGEGFRSLGAGPAEIDILVVHTPGSLDLTLRTDLVLNVERLNRTFSNSGINARANLLHIEQVDYTPSGDLSTDNERLWLKSDGHLDTVPNLAHGLGADLVCLVVHSQTAGWLGFAKTLTPARESGKWLCSTVWRYSLANDSWVFTHEIGHNLGGAHQRAPNYSPVQYRSYSYDFVSTAGQFATMLANLPGQPYIEHFSNPNISVNGQATGVAQSEANSADNAATFNHTAPLIAGWGTPTRLVSPRFSGNQFAFDITGPTASGNMEASSPFGKLVGAWGRVHRRLFGFEQYFCQRSFLPNCEDDYGVHIG